jgi:CheY-like chemotaxis protein
MHKACVLILEDNPTELATFQLKIKKYLLPGDVVYTATSGKEAIAVIEAQGKTANRPCIFVLDLNMPGEIKGFDVLRWIRQQPEYADCAIVILTSSDDAQDEAKAMSLGATRFYTKPRMMIQVGALLKTILDDFRHLGGGNG